MMMLEIYSGTREYAKNSARINVPANMPVTFQLTLVMV